MKLVSNHIKSKRTFLFALQILKEKSFSGLSHGGVYRVKHSHPILTPYQVFPEFTILVDLPNFFS